MMVEGTVIVESTTTTTRPEEEAQQDNSVDVVDYGYGMPHVNGAPPASVAEIHPTLTIPPPASSSAEEGEEAQDDDTDDDDDVNLDVYGYGVQVNGATTTTPAIHPTLPPPPASSSAQGGLAFPKRPTLRRSALMGLRTVSTQKHEQQQQQKAALRTKRQVSNDTAATETSTLSSAVNNFAVRSIRRGTGEWQELVKPFVADLAFESVVSGHFSQRHDLQFRPYTCQAAVLFVDISGYSKIASALQHRGAHALSTAVNSYLSRILRLVRQYGGDVVKFAGDAVLCLWHSRPPADGLRKSGCSSQTNDSNKPHPEDLQLRQNVLAAALCATQLQKQAGRHAVDGTTHEFRIHAGLCSGTVESEIFVAPVCTNMQRMYHLVGGEALEEIGDLVDYAKAGQVCVSADIVQHLAAISDATTAKTEGGTAAEAVVAQYQPVPDFQEDSDDDYDSEDEEKDPPQLLVDLVVDDDTAEAVEHLVEDTMIERLHLRDQTMEEDFIHPAVLSLLSHGGLSPTQIAQMRDLVVLFIAQTSHGAPANWLLEVQAILDRHQCPLLQIVADDKGVHAIAAVNAVQAVPESRLLGLEIGRQLVRQQVGVAIGMAAGSTFCGVTGSSSIACRWDITGGPPVRAARLMQYALAKNVPLAIDESLYAGSITPARMTLLEDGVPIKGSPEPIRVFALSDATEFAAMNLLETVHGDMHEAQTQAITKHITGSRHRAAVVVTGPTLAGKKIVCQRAAGFADMVPFLHVSDSARGLLQLVRTVAKWFKYVEEEDIHNKAMSVLSLMDQGLYSRAHDECLALVDDAMDAGLVSCFVVDRVEFLDEFSVSFIRECLHGRRYRIAAASSPPKLGMNRPDLRDSLSNGSQHGGSAGRIAFLCVHVPFYNSPSADSVSQDITRSHRSLCVPIIKVREATLQQFRDLYSSMSMTRFEDRLNYVASAAAGHCAGYLIERSAAIAAMQPIRVKNGQRPLVMLREDFTYSIPPGSLRDYRNVSVMQIGNEIAMRYAHVYDELPPIMQVFCKVLAVVSQTGFYWAPRQRVWEVLNDLIAEGVTDDTMAILLKEMSTLYLICVWSDDKGVEYVKFQSPGLSDIAMDVCTPVQVEHIAKAWIGRLKPDLQGDFRVALVLAWLNVMLDPCKKCRRQHGKSVRHWQEGYGAMLKVAQEEQWETSKVNRWKELIAAEIEAGGSNELEVLGSDFSYGGTPPKAVDPGFLGVWWYRGPIGLGPLGNTMSVIAEEIMREVLFVSGAGSADQQHLERPHMMSAIKRYMKEVEIVEDLLLKHDLGAEPSELYAETLVLEKIATPTTDKSQIYEKGITFMQTVVRRFVESRLDRLRSLAERLDGADPPAFVTKTGCNAVFTAYNIMFQQWTCVTQANEVDRAQHALMILATRGWQPRTTPEPMGHLKRQTVARLRNAVVRKLSEGQLHFSKHQQSSVDLKAFLLTTALLFDAQDTGKYEV